MHEAEGTNQRRVAPSVRGLGHGTHLESLEDALGICTRDCFPFCSLLWGVGDEVNRLF